VGLQPHDSRPPSFREIKSASKPRPPPAQPRTSRREGTKIAQSETLGTGSVFCEKKYAAKPRSNLSSGAVASASPTSCQAACRFESNMTERIGEKVPIEKISKSQTGLYEGQIRKPATRGGTHKEAGALICQEEQLGPTPMNSLLSSVLQDPISSSGLRSAILRGRGIVYRKERGRT